MEITHLTECYYCAFKKNIPYSAHISCSNPMTDMKCDQYGKNNGWFNYPVNFDPIWKEHHCINFKHKKIMDKELTTKITYRNLYISQAGNEFCYGRNEYKTKEEAEKAQQVVPGFRWFDAIPSRPWACVEE